jgi:mycothione reductase
MRHFDLCIVGSGSGNTIVDERFAEWRVALVDGQKWFGGTCLNVGCIPTKMFAHPADVAEEARHAARLGVDVGEVHVRWPDIRDRVFGRIDPIVAAGEAYRRDSANVALFRDMGRFIAPRMMRVGDEQFTADRFVLAAGSRPVIPAVPGIDDPDLAGRVHTSDTIMRLDALPKSLIIVGGGLVAVEFAHIFAAYGTQVTLLHRGARLLKTADEAVAQRFTDLLSRRVVLRLGQHLASVADAAGRIEVGTTDDDGIEYFFEAEQLLIATGRMPNSDTLNLAATGVEVDERGLVVVDDYQRTTADGIWALGDLSGHWQLKHVANHEARVVQHNLLHPDDLVASDHRFVPQAVFSGPQLACVGLTEQQCRDQGIRYAVGVRDYGGVAFGWALEDTDHFAKVIADPATGALLGAHIIGPDAANLIQPLIQAMSFGLDVRAMARGQYWIHPALAEVIENALLAVELDG